MARRRRRRERVTFPPVTGSTTARGYGSTHQAERRRWAPIVQTGQVPCCRCGFLIGANERWHLDHSDDGIHYLGPSHARCNILAAARLGSRWAREKKAGDAEEARLGWVASREW
jgi:hypothetical protein